MMGHKQLRRLMRDNFLMLMLDELTYGSTVLDLLVMNKEELFWGDLDAVS